MVRDLDEAIAHIRRFSSQHTDAIVTEDLAAARRFTAAVDSAAVLVNASTRFTDGGEFGFGAEIGISTQKLHARGPMGLPEMTSTKYVVTGDGHIRYARPVGCRPCCSPLSPPRPTKKSTKPQLDRRGYRPRHPRCC